jgi:hypothetical protein
MMAKVGIHVARLSDKSVKSLAVTKAMMKGMTTVSAREHGRWKTKTMPGAQRRLCWNDSYLTCYMYMLARLWNAGLRKK